MTTKSTSEPMPQDLLALVNDVERWSKELGYDVERDQQVDFGRQFEKLYIRFPKQSFPPKPVFVFEPSPPVRDGAWWIAELFNLNTLESLVLTAVNGGWKIHKSVSGAKEFEIVPFDKPEFEAALAFLASGEHS